MSSDSKITITLSSNNADATMSITRPDGVSVEKCVSVEELMAALAKRHERSTGIVPPNTRFFKGDSSNYTIVIESPAKVRRFLLHSNVQRYEQGNKYTPRELMIPFPNCVFRFDVVNKKLRNTKLFSTPNRISSNSDILCYFPFGNVYDGGRICWGHVTLPEIRSPMSLIGVVAMFFDAPFNGDLTERRIFRSPGSIEIRDFWGLVSHLEGQPRFPIDMLASTEITFRQMVRDA